MQLPTLKWDDNGLIPAVIQDSSTKDVLMVAWMDAEALERTITTRTTWFWSRSRQEYWNKGATSGNVQKVDRVLYDCDEDTLLVFVTPAGPACHTGETTCFYREIDLG